MKKILISLSLIIVTGCSATNLPVINPVMNTNQQPNITQNSNVQAQSFKGVYKAIEEGIKASFAQKDKNKDGFITPDEFVIQTDEDYKAFRRLDENWDGKLSLKEMTPGLFSKIKGTLSLQSNASFVFNTLDIRPKDDKISKNEILSSHMPDLAKNFDKFDKNSKGYLTKSEFEDLYAYYVMKVEP